MKKTIIAVLVVICVTISCMFMLTSCRKTIIPKDAINMVNEMVEKLEPNINMNVTITRKEGPLTRTTEMKFREGIFSTKQASVLINGSETLTTTDYERYITKSTLNEIEQYTVIQYVEHNDDSVAQYQSEVLPAESDFYDKYKSAILGEIYSGIWFPKNENSITDISGKGNDYTLYYSHEGTTNALVFESYLKKINETLYSFYKIKSYTRTSDSYKITYEFSYDGVISNLPAINIPSTDAMTEATKRFDWVNTHYPYVPPVETPDDTDPPVDDEQPVVPPVDDSDNTPDSQEPVTE